MKKINRLLNKRFFRIDEATKLTEEMWNKLLKVRSSGVVEIIRQDSKQTQMEAGVKWLRKK